MHTRVGTVALAVLAQHDATEISLDTPALLDAVAAGAHVRSTRPDHAVLESLGRDDRFVVASRTSARGTTQQRRIRVFRRADAAPTTSPMPLAVPPDPRAGQHLAARMLNLPAHQATPDLLHALVALLAQHLATLSPLQQACFVAAFGLDGAPPRTHAAIAHAQGRSLRVVRHSVDDAARRMAQRCGPHADDLQAGTPAPALPFDDPALWANVVRGDGADACWTYTGALDHGVPRIKRHGKAVVATRYVYERLCGPIPEGHRLVRTCGAARCVRPEHLVALRPEDVPNSPLLPRRTSG